MVFFRNHQIHHLPRISMARRVSTCFHIRQGAHLSMYSWTLPVSHAPAHGAAARFPQFSTGRWLPVVKWPLDTTGCWLFIVADLSFHFNIFDTLENHLGLMMLMKWMWQTPWDMFVDLHLPRWLLWLPILLAIGCSKCRGALVTVRPMSGCSEFSCAGEVDGRTIPWRTGDSRRYLLRNSSATRCLSDLWLSLLTFESSCYVCPVSNLTYILDSLCFSISQCFFNCCKGADLVVILLRVFSIAVMHRTFPLLSTQIATTAQRRLQFLIVTSLTSKGAEVYEFWDKHGPVRIQL